MIKKLDNGLKINKIGNYIKVVINMNYINLNKKIMGTYVQIKLSNLSHYVMIYLNYQFYKIIEVVS